MKHKFSGTDSYHTLRTGRYHAPVQLFVFI